MLVIMSELRVNTLANHGHRFIFDFASIRSKQRLLSQKFRFFTMRNKDFLRILIVCDIPDEMNSMLLAECEGL